MNIDISQGSAATRLRCGGIISEHFVANLRVNLSAKEFENLSIFGKVMGKDIVIVFLTHNLVVVVT